MIKLNEDERKKTNSKLEIPDTVTKEGCRHESLQHRRQTRQHLRREEQMQPGIRGKMMAAPTGQCGASWCSVVCDYEPVSAKRMFQELEQQTAW